jgi:transaldolase
MNSIKKLHSLGQSIWYDNIERQLLTSGEMAAMIDRGKIRGVTSNPSIFNNAIAKSNDYDHALEPLAKEGASKEKIYEALAVKDIRDACDLFRPLYDESVGGDGFVSLEVSPYLAHDTLGTVKDAARLWKLVDRPNLMIKIPGTRKGLPAITQSIAAGINVNVTLIFSIERYEKVMEAYLDGLDQRLASGQPIDHVASVASFFVSRIDSNIDSRLESLGGDGAKELQGKIAVANAKLAYAHHKEIFAGQRWDQLRSAGGNIQRALWASTSTKNPSYPDTKYVDELIGPNTVNTVPPKTLIAFQDHGTAELTLESDLEAAQAAMDELALLDISMAEVTQELEDQGVKAFADAFTALLESVEKRRVAVV